MSTKTYDPGLILITIGPFLVTGFADGTFVKVARDEDTWKKNVGADGEVARIKSRNRAGYVELTLQQTSPTNALLSELAFVDEIAPGSASVVVTIRDVGGATIVHAAEAWVCKPPDSEFSKDMSTRVWKLDTGVLNVFLGGNF